MRDWGDTLIIGFMLVCALCAISIIGLCGWASYTEWKLGQLCKQRGYPASSYSRFGESYCVRRLDQTDGVALPLSWGGDL